MARQSQYPEEFRRQAAALVLDSGRTLRDVGRELGVGHDLAGRALPRGQRRTEEPPGGVGVPTRRDEHVDDLTVLVHCPVDVPPDAVDLDVGLVHEPTRSPAEWRENRAASASSGVNRCTHR